MWCAELVQVRETRLDNIFVFQANQLKTGKMTVDGLCYRYSISALLYFSYASLRAFIGSSFSLIVLIARIGGLWENVLCWVSSGPRDETGERIHVPSEPTVCNFAHVLLCCIVHSVHCICWRVVRQISLTML